VERFCNKCGYFGPDEQHQRPNGSGQCGYLSSLAAPGAAIAAREQEAETWLIEDQDHFPRHRWLRIVEETKRAYLSWTEDANIAARFARRDDAVGFQKLHVDFCALSIVTGHTFMDMPPALASREQEADDSAELTMDQIHAIDARGPLIEGWRVELENGRNGWGIYAYYGQIHCEEDCFFLLSVPEPASRNEAPAASSQETWQHVANEWADMATNAMQGVRNIIDGIAKPEEVIANLNFCYSHCAEVQSRAKPGSPTAARSPATVAQPVGERWIIARETVISDVPDSRPILGYTVFADSFTSFDTFEEASAALGELKLPLGWACMRTTQAPWPSLFAQPCPSQGCGGEGSDVLTEAQIEELYALACRDWNEATGEFPSVGVFLARRIFAFLSTTKSEGPAA
jgi:hypothetical protein